ncbi:MAG: Radical SAM domain protein [Desulfotomaculum sp. 46_296]|nr:MAG: Radical SAM domain protein [Desulfotomaculum sp. 46_296]
MVTLEDRFSAILDRAEKTHSLSREDIATLLRAEGEQSQALFQKADDVRKRHLGNGVHLRAIIEFSNNCIKNCLYCGLRRDNRKLTRYRMTVDEIFSAAFNASREGFKTIVLQAGEDPYYKPEVIADLVRRMKSCSDVAVTLSLGDLTKDAYQKMRLAGADRYLLKFETSEPLLFGRLRPGTNLTGRLKQLSLLKELGYQVGSGNITGLPGQSLESVAEDILLLRELEVEMAGIGPFIPHQQTPLRNSLPGDLYLNLKVLAVTRLLLPLTHLPATTATAAVHPSGRRLALKAGANVVMPDLTPLPYRSYYDIYPGRAGIQVSNSYSWWNEELEQIERSIAGGYGHGAIHTSPDQQF